MLMVTVITLLLVLVVRFSACEGPSTVNEERLLSWAETVYLYVRDANCQEATFTSPVECGKLQKRERALVNVYAAYTTTASAGGLTAVLPDGGLRRQGPHDAILALDPYPRASFGHLVLIFTIDYHSNRSGCELKMGIYTNSGECVVLAHKNRCHNRVDRESGGSDFMRRCEIDFLPLVQHEDLPTTQLNQQLQCYHLPGFAACPDWRPKNETSKLICNPLDSNRHHCQLANEMALHTRCRLLETCDQALIMAGGWNRDHSRPGTADNVANFYRMLRSNGFHKNNIKVYYANGASASKLVGEDVHTVYPSAMKLAYRYHVQKICQSPLCGDSLVIYLNSPATNDGHFLLWDVDSNGEMDVTEAYTVRELYTDLRSCSARQVYVFVDQSYAGQLVNYFSRSTHHSNVIIVASGQEDDYSFDGEFTKYWTRPGVRHVGTCVTQLHESSHSVVKMSRPTIHDGSWGRTRTTVSGAPCDVTPPFSAEELRANYFGCQNVPTRVWLNRFVTSGNRDEDD